MADPIKQSKVGLSTEVQRFAISLFFCSGFFCLFSSFLPFLPDSCLICYTHFLRTFQSIYSFPFLSQNHSILHTITISSLLFSLLFPKFVFPLFPDLSCFLLFIRSSFSPFCASSPLFRCVLASLYEGLSVRPSVGWLVS